jgi:hypothetical protein
LIKCQSSKNGQPNPEATQVISLLEDMKSSPIKAQTAKKNWKFLETTPHSPGGKKPFIGGAK